MRKALIFFILLSMLTLSSAETEEIRVNSPYIESATVHSPENITANITLLNKSEQEKINGVGVLESFKLKMSYYENVKFVFNENKSFAQSFIENNSELYGGPGHKYDSGMISLIREENKQHLDVINKNNNLTKTITDEGTYYLVITSTANTPETYVNEDGECLRIINAPSRGYEKVDSCEETDWKLISIIILLLGIGSTLSYITYRKLREKYLIRKLVSMSNEIETSGRRGDDQLQSLYQAMEDVEKGNFKDASNLIKQIEKGKN